MSHELRSPLTTVLGCTDLLDSVQGLNAEAQEYIQLIQSAGNHLLTIINDILDFSKITSDNVDFRLSLSTFDPRLLATMATKMFVPQAMSNNVKLKVETSELPSGLRVRGDETRIEQILVNFLSNAIKFTPHGGEVTLTLAAWRPSLEHLEALAAVARKEQAAALTKGGRVTAAAGEASASDSLTSTSAEGRPIMLSISVTDTGIGMSPEVQANLFEAFRQGNVGGSTRQYGGTGLGLCISAKIAALMGCPKIQVTSAVGKGSTFKVDLLLEEVNQHRRSVQFADTSWIADADTTYAPESSSSSTQTNRHIVPKVANSLCEPLEPAAVSGTLYEFDPVAVQKQKATSRNNLDNTEESSFPHAKRHDLNDSKHAPASLPLSGLRVLLAEDVKSIRMLGQRMLSRAGAKCTTAADGVLAVAAVRASIAKNHPFDCVLMDFHMPNMDGMGAMQAIRATHGAQAPVIFGFTADVLDNTAHAFAAGGAVAVLNKPYNLNDIVARIHEFVPKRNVT